jgi:hypothetical protein
MNWMMTGNYLIIHPANSKPHIIERSSETFEKLFKLLSSNVSDEEVLKEIDVKKAIETYSEKEIVIDTERETVFIDNKEVDETLTKRIISFYNQDLPYKPLFNFWRNIQKNPNVESVKDLFTFLDKNNMPFTADGCFLAYKKVIADDKGNLVDGRTKSICNNVGTIVSIDRNSVDSNRNNTCSHGLHVAAYDYAKNCYDGSHLLEVKVNPSNVVSVPIDYDFQKMRVCEYEVVGVTSEDSLTNKLYIKNEEVEEKTQKGKRQLENERVDKQIEFFSSKALDTLDFKSLETLPARAIVKIIENKTGEHIDVDLKNKKRIIKIAYQKLFLNRDLLMDEDDDSDDYDNYDYNNF